jgi:hypothetical protein
MSAAFAGGGVQDGRVIGASDACGAYPRENRKLPRDVRATIYRHLDVATQVTSVESVETVSWYGEKGRHW